MAARSSGMPGLGGYWLRPPLIAAIAASAISIGPSVSGKPWPRLTDPVATASADISAKIVVPRPCSRSASRSRVMATPSHGPVMSGSRPFGGVLLTVADGRVRGEDTRKPYAVSLGDRSQQAAGGDRLVGRVAARGAGLPGEDDGFLQPCYLVAQPVHLDQ